MQNIFFPEKFKELPEIRYFSIVDFNLYHRNAWHKSVRSDLIYIISGNTTVILPGVSELKFFASPGDVLVMKGQLPHKDVFKTSKGLKAMIISYQWAGDEDFFAAENGFEVRKFESGQNGEARWQLERMLEYLGKNSNSYKSNMIAACRLHTILLLLYELMFVDKVMDSEIIMPYNLEDLLKAAENYIQCNYNSPTLNRAETAAALNVSISTLSRAFEHCSGYTFLQYLTQIRLYATKKLLRERKCRVSEVAQLCGFSDPGYFARVFKKTFGISPVKYR